MYFTIIYRTIFLYIFILISYRIMGKKEVGELNIIDLIVSFSIAELASISIESTEKSIFTSIIPITILVLLEMLLSYIGMKSDKFRILTDGRPELLINNGKIDFKIMKKLRYTIDDLLTQIRSKNIISLKDVKYAVLETDGSLSVFREDNYPLPLIINGKIEFNKLKNISKNKYFLYKILEDKKVSLKNIFYAIYYNNLVYIITFKDVS